MSIAISGKASLQKLESSLESKANSGALPPNQQTALAALQALLSGHKPTAGKA